VKIGVSCYPTIGGSGIVATELGGELARRGHEVHFVADQIPYRLVTHGSILFHEVRTTNYPVFRSPPYSLALAAKLAEVASFYGLDLFHVHYAIPHAASAFLAREMVSERRVRVVTTLHGTDITLVGADPSFFRLTKFSIERSDGVTAVSDFLRRETIERFGITRPVLTIPNFVDPERFSPARKKELREQFGLGCGKVLMHASNFRRVKNVRDVVKTFARVAERMPSCLVMVGDGPEREPAQILAEDYGISDRVFFMGDQREVEAILPAADLFLLPSSQESFGLVALEAMSCGVPVIGCRAGGLPELIVEGETGHLLEVGDVDGMAAAALRVLGSEPLRERLANAARERAVTVYPMEKVVDRYEAFYGEVLG
jgi:N-acetyl-alpha-D-glucosaminyl L-malate synthase BshA